jgi:hypothetical protein
MSIKCDFEQHLSITKLTVACLECGREMKQLTRRHLQEHGLNNQTYRSKYGIPPTQPLSARATTRRRQQIVQEVQRWEKAPGYRTAQQKQSATAGAVVEEIETPAPPDEARPRRQRKTTLKKQTGRKSSRGA